MVPDTFADKMKEGEWGELAICMLIDVFLDGLGDPYFYIKVAISVKLLLSRLRTGDSYGENNPIFLFFLVVEEP